MQLFQLPFIRAEAFWAQVYNHKDSKLHLYCYNELTPHNEFYVDYLGCTRILCIKISNSYRRLVTSKKKIDAKRGGPKTKKPVGELIT